MTRPCLLVIDDNAINLALVNYLLNAAGFDVVSADDGAKGLAALQAGPRFGAILCDIQMPVMDGFEFARRTKADPRWATVPLVAITALAMVGDKERIMAAGFDAYLPKPIEPASFIASVLGAVPALAEHAASGHPTSGPAVEPATPAPKASGWGRLILVLDDSPYNLALKRGLLEPLGYAVVTADTPQGALSLARQRRPDLIISDIGTREGTGFDFIADVKADADLRRVPFIFLTATHWDDEARRRSIELGACRFLRRPIDSASLLGEISACLAQQGATADVSTRRY